jgi:molybdenum cofactor cytidylyltransferase
VLAAGEGSRFRRGPKLLADFGGRPLLEHAVAAACAVEELDPVVVVLGCHAERIGAAVDFGRARAVVCEAWADGMSASLRTGAGAIEGAVRAIVCLGDAPDVGPGLIRRMLGAPDGARAVYGGHPGHPVVLGPEQLRRLGELRGDTGARELLGDGSLIECGDLASGRDIDTTKDLEEMHRAARAVV